jgi:hypothetical protein
MTLGCPPVRPSTTVTRKRLVILTVVLALVLPVPAVLVYDAATKLAKSLPDPCAVLEANRPALGVTVPFKADPDERGTFWAERSCTPARDPQHHVFLRFRSFGRTLLASPTGNAHAEYVRSAEFSPALKQQTVLDGVGDAAFAEQFGPRPDDSRSVSAGAQRANVVVLFSYDNRTRGDLRPLARDVLAAAVAQIRLD